MKGMIFGARSYLFVPSHIDKFYKKAEESNADIIVLDLEDSVPQTHKSLGRSNIENYFQSRKDVNMARYMIRLSSSGDNERKKDILIAAKHGINNILVAKVESKKILEEVANAYKDAAGVQARIKLYALIESAIGMESLDEVCQAEDMKGIVFGHEDYMASMEATNNEDLYILNYARSKILNKCKKYGLCGIDSPYLEIRNMEGCMSYACRSRANGFDGMLVIHPDQVDLVNEAYKGTEEELVISAKIKEAYDEARRKGMNIVFIDNKFIAPPIVKSAIKLIERWRYYSNE